MTPFLLSGFASGFTKIKSIPRETDTLNQYLKPKTITHNRVKTLKYLF
tara:strand:+ start:1108 stop:1251 length:144 start_codon:yes stop_codon:yes gene_type:complete